VPLISAPEISEQTRAQTIEEQLLGGRSNALRAKGARPIRNRALSRLLFRLLLLVPESVVAVLLFGARFVVLPTAGVFDGKQRSARPDADAGPTSGLYYSLKNVAAMLRLKSEVLKSPIVRQSAGRSSGFG